MAGNVFCPATVDRTLSPYTGLTRQSWIEAGEYLLEGAFRHIQHFDDPMVLPRQIEGVIYPHDPSNVQQIKAEYFEGLTRTMFIAAPLIRENPGLTLNGINLRDYYKSHILRACTRGDEQCVGHYEDLCAWADARRAAAAEADGKPAPRQPGWHIFQQTVETCALVICLWITKDVIWDTYTKAERDRIAEFLTGYANAPTAPNNWRLFNMLDLAFLNMEGYPIDERIMLEHATRISDYYVGDGWYRDAAAFDYYSCWAFNVYAPLWNEWYGYEHMPYVAQRFEEWSNTLMASYARMFDRDGFTTMWGRSNVYRFAAVSPFAANLTLPRRDGKAYAIDPGLARRIASGSLMQFLGRDDFLHDGVPTMGFYGQFTPLVQGYSCTESPYWMGKGFLCLLLDENHPFWTATEQGGLWEQLGENDVTQTALDGPAICISNHGGNGETVLRTGKVERGRDDLHGMWNYGKLCFDSKFPWESTPKPEAGTESQNAGEQPAVQPAIQPGAVESQQYVMHDLVDDTLQYGNLTLWGGQKDGVLYRRQHFAFRGGQEGNAIDLADIALPYGILRADKLRVNGHPVELTLGAYGFADNGTEIIRREHQGAQAIVLKGHDHTGQPRQLAMTIFDGWEGIDVMHSAGSNPDSPRSIVVYGRTARREQYHFAPYLLLSQVITKTSLDDFSDDELFPIRSVEYTDPQSVGAYGPVRLTLADGTVHTIDFTGLEGRLMR